MGRGRGGPRRRQHVRNAAERRGRRVRPHPRCHLGGRARPPRAAQRLAARRHRRRVRPARAPRRVPRRRALGRGGLGGRQDAAGAVPLRHRDRGLPARAGGPGRRAPRASTCCIADDVGLGKTIEAGLVVQELLLRHRARRVMVVCPAGADGEVAGGDGREVRPRVRHRRLASAASGSAATAASAREPVHGLPADHRQPALAARPARRSGCSTRCCRPTGTPTPPRLRPADRRRGAPRRPGGAAAGTRSTPSRPRRSAGSPRTSSTGCSCRPPRTTATRSRSPRCWRCSTPALRPRASSRTRRRCSRSGPAAQARHRRTPTARPGSSSGEIAAIAVEYPERRARRCTACSREYTDAAPRAAASRRRGARPPTWSTLLLKKRLFSSPAAFAHTVGVYLETLDRRPDGRSRGAERRRRPQWLDERRCDDDDCDDDDARRDRGRGPRPASALQAAPGHGRRRRSTCCDRCCAGPTRTGQARRQGTALLISYLRPSADRDGGLERRAGRRLHRVPRHPEAGSPSCSPEGLAGPRIALLYGGMDADEREQLRPSSRPTRPITRSGSCSPPTPPARASTCSGTAAGWSTTTSRSTPTGSSSATAASTATASRPHPTIRHFVGTGWEPRRRRLRGRPGVPRPGSPARSSTMRDDLGSVNAGARRRGAAARCSAEPRRPSTSSRRPTPARRPTDLPVDTRRPRQVRRLRERARQHRRRAGHHARRRRAGRRHRPGAGPPAPLRPHLDDRRLDDRLFDVPPLTGSWQRAPPGSPRSWRPPTGATAAARHVRPDAPPVNRDDVVLAHLNHPLVAMSTRLLRAAVSHADTGLHRVTAVLSDDPALEDVLVGAFSRFVLVGADGVRLHEEVLHAGGWMPERGRFRRWENFGALRAVVSRALADGVAGAAARPGAAGGALAGRCRDGVLAAIDWRTNAGERVAGAQARRTRAGGAEQRSPTGSTASRQHAGGALAEDDRGRAALFSRARGREDPRRARAVPPRPAVVGRASRPAAARA